MEDVTADVERGKATLRWWRYESWEWTGHVEEPGFWAESRVSDRMGEFDFYRYGASDLGCWLHRRFAGVELHAADERGRSGEIAHRWYHDWWIGLPLWLVVAVTGVLPAWYAFVRRRLRGHNKRGFDAVYATDSCATLAGRTEDEGVMR